MSNRGPMTLSPKPGVMEIDAYVPGRSDAKGAARVFKLSSNESPFGPSPKAIAAYEAAEPVLGMYPEGSARILREAIAAHYGLASDRIVCGNGSDEILTLLANCYVRPKDEVIFSAHAFSLYKIVTLANSGVPVEVPTPDLKLDVGDLIAHVSPKTRLVYIANPNNPTASYVSVPDMRRLHAALPDSALLVIDAAYSEYVKRNDYEAGIELVSTSSQCGDDAHLLEGLRPGGLARRLGLLSQTCGRRAPSRARALQRQYRSPEGGGGGACGSLAYRDQPGSQ